MEMSWSNCEVLDCKQSLFARPSGRRSDNYSCCLIALASCIGTVSVANYSSQLRLLLSGPRVLKQS